MFYNSKLKICALLDLIYFWCVDLTQNKTRVEVNTKSKTTTSSWYKKLRKLSYDMMLEINDQFIGGSGHVGEIDESLFSKRKYNVGRLVRKMWVVGGIDLDDGKSFFAETLFRDKESLNSIILNHVAKGTIIITDEWEGYNDLNSLGYIHLTVNHNENFVDPISGANTQRIECEWGVLKRKLRARGITNREELLFYFSEFCAKRKFKENLFEMILKRL